jgi:hypothetical protein
MRRSLIKTSNRPVSRFLPQVEALESRWCPSTSGIVQSGSALVIQGDGANDTISVSDNGQGGVTASITLAKRTQTLSATGITSIQINAGNGNDTINYALTGALSQPESLTLSLGKGRSQANLDFSAGLTNSALAVHIAGRAGASQLTTQFGALSNSRLNLGEFLGLAGGTSHVNFGGPVSGSLVVVSVSGGPANDQVFAQVGDVSNSNIQFFGHLGKGANTFDLEAAGNLQNAVVHYDISAGSGGNTFTFNAQGVNLDMTSRLNLESQCGSGNDRATLNYSGVMDGELWAHLLGGPGNDTMNAAETLASGSTGRVWEGLHGGRGDDTMTFDISDQSNPGGKSTLSLLDALLEGGPGHDQLTATPNVRVIQ